MKASLKWLKEYVDFSLSPEQIAKAFTMAGLEVENVEEREDDHILEVNVTPNRPDCLSIRGLARELSVVLGLPLKDRRVIIEDEEEDGPCIEIKDTSLCSRYSSRIIKGVKVGPSPEWVRKRIESHGFRAANNIVDITNYVLLEMGHPLHAFDLGNLDGGRIVVMPSGSVTDFRTLDSEKRTLRPEMLLIWDARKPVAIAGIMGGIETEVTGSTADVLLESAYFEPRSIRRTSRALNLTTEASYRFERGADIEITVRAINRATRLILDMAGGKPTRITDHYPSVPAQKSVTVRQARIRRTLGTEVPLSRVKDVLNGLGIANDLRTDTASGEGTAQKKSEVFTVFPPSFRPDIREEMDVIEEIARIFGYDRIPASLPNISMNLSHPGDSPWKLMRIVKDSLRKSGYSETINYSFLNTISLDKLRIPPGDRRRDFITIRNPLRKEDEALRTTLIPSLLETVRSNTARGERSLRFFECSAVFIDSGQKLPDEKKMLSAVYVKDDILSLWQRKHDGFYDIKGVAENLILELGIKKYAFVNGHGETGEPYLHPGKSCRVKIGDSTVAVLGALHPEVAQSFEIPSETFLLEMDLDRVFSTVPEKITFSPLPKFPYVERDLAIVVSRDISSAEAEAVIWNTDTGLIESVTLFDVYDGQPVPEGCKSLAFSIRYRSSDRTLTAEEINELHSIVVRKLSDSLNATLRG